MSKNSEGVRFSGGDNLTGLQKLYHEVMMMNELHDGKGAYKLSYAGDKSGPSFGGNQMDIYANEDAREVLLNIIVNAKDKVPGLALSDEEINAIEKKLNPIESEEPDKKLPLDFKHLQGTPEQVLGAKETIEINKILASDYGIQEVNKAYIVDMKDKAKKIDRVISKIAKPAAKEFYSTTEGKVLLFDYNNQFNITESGEKAKLVNFLNSGSTTIYTSKDTQGSIEFSDKYTAGIHKQYVMGTKEANNTEQTRQGLENRLNNVHVILGKNKDIEVNPQIPQVSKDPKPTESSQEQKLPKTSKNTQDQQQNNEAQVGAKEEKVKLEQELALAKLECETASAEWSNGLGKGVPQDDLEHISRDEKCQATFKKVRSLKQKLNGNSIEQTEKVEQAKLEKAKQEEEVKQKGEANKKAAVEETAKQQEQKSIAAEAKEKQEESKKAQQEQVNQNQEAKQQKQGQETAQQQSQNQSDVNQTNNGELTDFVLTEEEEATIERTISERSASEAKAKAEQESNEAVAVVKQQKENQALHNSIERDQLERSGVKLSAHDKIADSNPNTEEMKLDHIGHGYIDQPGSALGNLSSVGENEVNKSLSYSSVGIKTSSGIGIIKGSDSSNKASVNTGNDTGYSGVGGSGGEGNSNQIPTIGITCENPTTHSDGQTYCGAEVLGDIASSGV